MELIQTIMLFLKKYWGRMLIGVGILALVAVVAFKNSNDTPDWVTDTARIGSVSNTIAVSGTMNAVESAELSFPASGILESVFVKEGDVVVKGMILATLAHDGLIAEQRDAEAALRIAQADYTELIAGLRPEERDITRTKVAIAKEELARVTREHDELVKSAYRTLLSSGLEVRPVRSDNDSTPPVLSGTYTCTEGTYSLTTYSSGSQSGYSYRLSGIEAGTFTAYTESPAPLGACGLSIQFIDGESYGIAEWEISIPNKESSSYIINKNAYDLAVTARANAIRAAEQALTLAEQTEVLDIADPRSESLTREEARVHQAEARVEKISAQIRDNILTAPFDGTITKIGPVPGEIIGSEPVVTIVSKNAFELTALIPEIDITKITIGQKADVVFDAQPDEVLPATISFVSPLAREIGGVSYFETKLVLDNPTAWLRSGLNADVTITIERRDNVLTVPRRYLTERDGAYTVLVPNGTETREVPVNVVFIGNDGYAEVEGLVEGDTVVAP